MASETHATILALHTAPSRALGVFADSTGTTRVVLPRTFHHPSNCNAPSTTSSIVHRAAPFSTIYLATERGKKLDERTIVVFLAGNERGGAAVFFGPGSVHNLAEKIPSATSPQPVTEKRGQLHALDRALSVIRRTVKRENEGIHTVVLATDSEYIVKSLTESVYEWRKSGWRDDAGEDVEMLKEMDGVIEKLAKEGLDVEFWKVGKEDNCDAEEMAAGVVRLLW